MRDAHEAISVRYLRGLSRAALRGARAARRRFGALALAAQALGSLAQPSADAGLAGRLRRGAGARLLDLAALVLRLWLGVRVVLAADQLDQRDIRAVAA